MKLVKIVLDEIKINPIEIEVNEDTTIKQAKDIIKARIKNLALEDKLVIRTSNWKEAKR